jgi:hypothetical protein
VSTLTSFLVSVGGQGTVAAADIDQQGNYRRFL